MTPTVKELLRQALERQGYDGLYDPDDDCACGLDDLIMCCGYPNECRAGYKTACDGSCRDGRCDYHISPCPPLGDPGGNPIRAIVYHGNVPTTVIVDINGHDVQYDFERCKRDKRVYYDESGSGPREDIIELNRMAYPEKPEGRCDLWLAYEQIAAVQGGGTLEEAGYDIIEEQPANPFDDAWEDRCYWCDACEDALPYDRPCEHLCRECGEPAPQLLAGFCGACCDVVVDGERIWKGSHAQWLVHFDFWGIPHSHELEDDA